VDTHVLALHAAKNPDFTTPGMKNIPPVTGKKADYDPDETTSNAG
jgi:hypothetical protein